MTPPPQGRDSAPEAPRYVQHSSFEPYQERIPIALRHSVRTFSLDHSPVPGQQGARRYDPTPGCMFSAAAACGPCGDGRAGTWSFPSGAGRSRLPGLRGGRAGGRQRHGRVWMRRQGPGKKGEGGVGSRVRDRRDQGPGAPGQSSAAWLTAARTPAGSPGSLPGSSAVIRWERNAARLTASSSSARSTARAEVGTSVASTESPRMRRARSATAPMTRADTAARSASTGALPRSSRRSR